MSDLISSHKRWPTLWVADIDNPGMGMPDEMWTGKWYAIDHHGEECTVEVNDDYNADLGRYLADLHNALPALLALVKAVQSRREDAPGSVLRALDAVEVTLT